MSGGLFSQLTVDQATFDNSRRILGWSSHAPAVCIGTLSGATLLDRALPSLHHIGAVSVSPTNLVAIVGTLKDNSEATAGGFVLSFIMGGAPSGSSHKLSWLTTAQQQEPLLRCLRVGTDDLCLVSAVGAQRLYLYNRRNASTSSSQSVASLALESELVAITDGPYHGSVVCALANGKVMVVDCSSTGGMLSVVSVADINTGIIGIQSVKCAGGSLFWILASGGRLVAFQACLSEQSSSHEREVEGASRAAAHGRSVSISRGELFTIQLASFAQLTQATTDASAEEQSSINNNCTGFMVSPNSLMWSDETSLSVSLVALGDDDAGEQSVVCTKVTVTPTLGAFVTSVAVGVEASQVLSLCALPTTWELLVLHPRKNVVDRISLDVPTALAANGPTVDISVDIITPPSSAASTAVSMSATVAWSSRDQLGLFRRRCEEALQTVNHVLSRATNTAEVQQQTHHLLSLQHAALAFLKRENTDTDGALSPDNSVSRQLLRQLRDAYVRATSVAFLLAVGFDTTKPVSEVLNLEQRRVDLKAKGENIRKEFYNSFAITRQQELPKDALARWGHDNQPPRLVIDAFVHHFGLQQLPLASLADVLLEFPKTVVKERADIGDAWSDAAIALTILLLYVSNASTLRDKHEVHQLSVELLRVMDLPSGLVAWAQLMYVADHVVSNEAESAEASSVLLPDSSCLDSCMPMLPQMLPSIFEGLLCGNNYNAALKLGRWSLSVYPRRTMPNALGSKLLLLAYRSGDASLIAQIAQHSQGTSLGRLAVRAVARVCLSLETLSVADGLYDRNSEEFALLEATFSEQAASEGTGSLVNASLLCELRLTAQRFESVERYSNEIAPAVTISHTQRFFAFRELLRAHLPSVDVGSADRTASTPSSSSTTSATTSAVSSSSQRASACLRQTDDTLNDAVRTTSTSRIASVRGTTSQARRSLASTNAFGGIGGGGMRGGSQATNRLSMAPAAPYSSDGVTCDRAIGHLGKLCRNPRPCPFHDADGR